MATEIECRILNIDPEQFKIKLAEIGASKIMDRLQRRYVYDLDPQDKNRWIRLRDDGQKVTLTVKEIHSDDIDGTEETEIVVDDFDQTDLMLNKLGYQHRAYQENKRSSYEYEGVEIEIDSWPKIPPYVEFEADSIDKIQNVVEKLGYTMSDTVSIGNVKIYQQYGINIHDFKELKF